MHYAELHAHSSFSFLDGASSPEELAEEAVRLGLDALTLTDHDGVYGIVRFAEAADALGPAHRVRRRTVTWTCRCPLPQAERSIAARVGVPDPPGHPPAGARPRPDRLRRAVAGDRRRHSCAAARRADRSTTSMNLPRSADGHWLVLTGCRKGAVRQALDCRRPTSGRRGARWPSWSTRFGRDNVAVELTHELDPLADERYEALAALAEEQRLPIVATTAAHYHGPPRRPLATAMAAVRARSSLDEIDGWLPAWAGQHLRSGAEMAAAVRPLAGRGRHRRPARRRRSPSRSS